MIEFLVGIVVVFLLGVGIFIGMVSTDDHIDIMKNEAIERGFALYCPKNGDFAWQGECE
tara:strand:+ start:268 stop:444 length:177 start_codon:yes stop_codon:yes gene_type:complete